MSTTPDAIQAWAAAETTVLNSLVTALNNITTGITNLDAMITAFQNSPGTLSAADQNALNNIQTASNALLTQAQAINTAAPGQAVPSTPVAGS